MGFLSKGTTLNWPDSVKHLDYVKKHAIIQFLHIYKNLKDRTGDVFLWGDEVEGFVVVVDGKEKTVRLSLRAHEILDVLEKSIEQIKRVNPHSTFHAHFAPEYGNFMVETTPGKPYGGTTADLILVEVNMRLRRQMVEETLQENERMMTLGSYPLMGVFEFTIPNLPRGGPVTHSLYIPDPIINPHPRFPTLTGNIRQRRGSKVDIRIPLFQDANTAQNAPKFVEQLTQYSRDYCAASPQASPQPSPAPSPTAESKSPPPQTSESKQTFAVDPVTEQDRAPPKDLNPAKQIYMDAMAFGMGCCCLQVTFQARHIREARHLYDHLAVLAPIMLSLTAATPFFAGRISDNDVRWTVISQSVDDRTPEERGTKPVDPKSGYRYINKSRYDSIDCFISLENNYKDKYNDLQLIYDQESYDALRNGGVDNLLARHMAHLFIRDPLVIYSEHIQIDDKTHSDHFENIQSTNWQTVRFKPPPPGTPIGWRVEFRSMEVQVTDFENAAFTVFIALLSRAILFFDLNLYIPITKVDENMGRAHRRDSARKEKFFFRKVIQVFQADSKQEAADSSADPDAFEEMSMAEIMCGKASFPGLIPIVKSYLDIIKCEEGSDIRKAVDRYLELIRRRACGELLTAAQWMREFVTLHPSYQKDSILPEDAVYDLVETLDGLAKGTVKAPELYGDLYSGGLSSPSVAAVLPAAEHSRPLLSSLPDACPCFELHLDRASCGEHIRQLHAKYQTQ